MIQQGALTVSSIILSRLDLWRRTKSILLLGLLFPLGHTFQYRKYACELEMQMNQAARLSWMESQGFVTMQAALYKILWGKHAWFLVTLKKKCQGYTPYKNTHSTRNRNVTQRRECFASNCWCSCCAKQMYKFSLPPKAKAQELRQVKKPRAEVGKNLCTALSGRCCKEEYFLTVSESTSGELVGSVSCSGIRNELLRILWQVIWSTKGYSRLYQEWGNHSHRHKSILAGKEYKRNKRGGGGKCFLCP